MTTFRRTLHILLLAVAGAVLLSACEDGRVYSRFVPAPVDGLEKNDTAVFDVPPMPASGRYRQEVGLRITAAYPFTNLCLQVEQTVEPGRRVRVDTLDCRLYDADGNVLGRGISVLQYGFILADVYLQKGDSLHVCVRHIMKREILPGIADIGFSMEAG